MTAEQNFFHRWWETSTIGYELEAIWEMSDTDYRATEVRDNPSQQGIVAGRLETIKTHLTHFLDFAGRETKLSFFVRLIFSKRYSQKMDILKLALYAFTI